VANDRTITINIKYNIYTGDVNKAKQASQQAQAATDQLRASATKTGASGATSYKPFIGSVETLTAKVLALKEQIRLSSDPSKVKALSDQYKALKTQLDATNKSLLGTNQAVKQVTDNTKSLGSQFTSLVSTVRLLLTAGLAKELVQVSLTMSTLAGNVDGVKKAFDKLPNSITLMNDLRKATHGTLDDLTLMQKAVQAKNFRIPLEQLGTLLEFAQIKAQQTGLDIEYLTNSLITGLGRASIKLLDNLQISAVELKQKTKELGSTQEATYAIVKEQLKTMGAYTENAATNVSQLSAAWKNLGITVSKYFESGSIPKALKGYVDAFQTLIEAQQKGVSISDVLRERRIKEAAQDGINILKANEFTDSNEKNLKITQDVITEKTHELILQQEENKEIEKSIELAKENLTRDYKTYDQQLKNITQKKDTIKANKDANAILIEQIKILKQLETSLQAPKEVTQAEIVNPGETLQQRRDLVKPKQIEITIDKDKVLKDFESLIGSLNKSIPPYQLKVTPYIPKDELDKFTDAFLKRKNDIIDQGNSMIENQINSVLQLQVTAYDIEINQTKRKYDAQIALAGDNEKAKDKLRIEEDKKIQRLEQQRNERQKKNALSSILINTALGIVKAFATSATIYDGIVEAALVAAEGASQYAIAARQPTGFAKGVIDLKGPGTGTSDSINARLSKGESVMTADETKRSMGILKAIRTNKIDDRILRGIDFSGGRQEFNDARIVGVLNKIEQKRNPDLVQQGRTIYEVHQVRSNFKRFIRSKSI
jgi:hypothetical protein